MILVATARLDEDVECSTTFGLPLERRLLPRVVQHKLEPLLVPELKCREDLAEVTARLLEDLLHAGKVGYAEDGDVDGLRNRDRACVST